MRLTRVLRAFLPAIAYAALVFALSARPEPPSFLPPELLARDKLLHAVEFGVLGALLVRGYHRLGVAPGRAVLLAVLLGSAFGASDEFHQAFVPGRNADVLDWVADTVGSSLGAILAGAVLAGSLARALRRPGGAG